MRQLISESTVNLVETNFKLNSAVQESNKQNLFTKYSTVNDFNNVSNGKLALHYNEFDFVRLIPENVGYAICEIFSKDLFYISYDVKNSVVISNEVDTEFNSLTYTTTYFLKTSSFSYKNSNNPILNIRLLNGFLEPNFALYFGLDKDSPTFQDDLLLAVQNFFSGSTSDPNLDDLSQLPYHVALEYYNNPKLKDVYLDYYCISNFDVVY